MTLTMTNQNVNIEIELDDDACIYDLANAFRAMAFSVGYSISNINEAIPSDHECR
jgi:hypothetical protein